jgi:hypothetical protein
MLDLTDARPDGERDGLLVFQMDCRLLDSLSYLCDVAENTLKTKSEAACLALQSAKRQLSQGVRVRANIYGIHFAMKSAMERADLLKVRELLDGLGTCNFVTDGIALRTLSETFEDRVFFDVVREDFERTYSTKFDTTKTTPIEVAQLSATANRVIGILKDYDTETFGELIAILTDILFIESSSINAGSSFKSFGLVYIRKLREDQLWTTYLEHIVHEAAHLHLFALWTTDPILEPSSEPGRYRSPLRKDLRPMSGLVHAAFVLARTIRSLRKLSRVDRYAEDIANMATSYNNAENSASFDQKFVEAFEIMKANAKLTAFGQKLMESTREMALCD